MANLRHKSVFTTGEAAEICGLSQQTIIRRFDSGKLGGFRVPVTKFRRIPRDKLVKFMKENKIPQDRLESDKVKVLIVDDDQDLVDLFVEVMGKDERFEVRTAGTGFGAGVEANRFRPDVILLDYLLPDISGLVVCKTVRQSEEFDDTHILIISGVVNRSELDQLLEAGADDFIKKPFGVPEVIERAFDLASGEPRTGGMSSGSPTTCSEVSAVRLQKPVRARIAKKLTWLHLSDLHIRQQGTVDRDIVLQAMWRDLAGLRSSGVELDFVVISGDVAYSGREHEYRLASEQFLKPLLDVTRLSGNQVVTVPGNHDLDRSGLGLLRNPVPDIQGEHDIRTLVENEATRHALLAPFSAYSTFVRSSLRQEFDEPAFVCVHRFLLGATSVVAVGVNSSWLSGYNVSADGRVDDRGRLAVCEYQAMEAVSATDGADIAIWVMHHPLDWLMPCDAEAIRPLLHKSFDLILHGHMHSADVVCVSSLRGGCAVIPAGSTYQSRQFANAYNVVEVDVATGECRALLRKYSDKAREWQRDIESTGDGADGVAGFSLKSPSVRSQSRVPSGYLAAFRNARKVFSKECLESARALSLTQHMLVSLVEKEFRSHVYYLKYPLENHPLPLGREYICYLTTQGGVIQFGRLLRCTHNQAELASWEDILHLYRLASRHPYRENPIHLSRDVKVLDRILEQRHDLRERIRKHFRRFRGVKLRPSQKASYAARKTASSGADEPAKAMDATALEEEVAYRLSTSGRADDRAMSAWTTMLDGDISDGNAEGIVVSQLELSLQHIHKILTSFPPSRGPLSEDGTGASKSK